NEVENLRVVGVGVRGPPCAGCLAGVPPGPPTQLDWSRSPTPTTPSPTTPSPTTPSQTRSTFSNSSLALILTSHRYSRLPLTPSPTIRHLDARHRNIGYLMAGVISAHRAQRRAI